MSILLRPLEALYAAAVGWRNRRLDDPDRVERVAVPVVSVGNLVAGGTGKTPMTVWIVRALQERGRRPAVVSRGYRGAARRGPVVVSRGAGPEVGPDVAGDEPWLLARSLPGAAVVVGSDRVAGARRAERDGADVVVLDDGFQHRGLHRDLDLVLLDATSPLGNGRLLPAGPLREPPAALRRAGALIATRCGPDGACRVTEAARAAGATAPVFASRHLRRGFVDANSAAAARPPRAVAFCGIARPETFRADLEAEGVQVVSFRAFRDHERIAPSQLRRLAASARSAGATLVTTEKDMARLAGVPAPDVPLLALSIGVEILDAASLLVLIDDGLSRGRP